MNKWLNTVDGNGFKGNIQVNMNFHSWNDPIVEVRITDKDGEILYDKHKHLSNPAEGLKTHIQDVIENIVWSLTE